MGEDPKRVFCFGAPGLDAIPGFKPEPKEELFRQLGVPEGAVVGAVTFHPSTLAGVGADRQIAELLKALKTVTGVFWVLTLPNADPGSGVIISALRRFVRANKGRASLHASLGRRRYLSLLRHARVVAGNSSSGLLEAPSFGLPAVNIGDRQEGRVRAASVIDVPEVKAAAIARGLRRALAPSSRRRAGRAINPYQGRDAGRRIVGVLKGLQLGPSLLKKRFHS
jgi:UDP-hydrolysing UDP-N-acetyl-D-glucosamine 2-epimerase